MAANQLKCHWKLSVHERNLKLSTLLTFLRTRQLLNDDLSQVAEEYFILGAENGNLRSLSNINSLLELSLYYLHKIKLLNERVQEIRNNP